MSRLLGQLIRERRLGLGLSLGQLATKVLTTAAVVRSWERGEDVPPEQARNVLVVLLDLDAEVMSALAEAAPKEPVEPKKGEPESPTELVQAAVGIAMTSVSPPVRPTAPESATDRGVDDPAVAAGAPMSDSVESIPVPEAGVVSGDALGETVPESTLLVEDPAAPRPVPLKYPHSVPAGVPVEISEPEPNIWNPLRYLYDPDKPWLYWIRAALTVIVLLVLFNILFDSVGELFNKLGEVIDSIEPADVVDEDVSGTP